MNEIKKGALKQASPKTPLLNLQVKERQVKEILKTNFPVTDKNRATFGNTNKGDILVRLPVYDSEFIKRAYVKEKTLHTIYIDMLDEEFELTRTGFDTDTFYHADPEDIRTHNLGRYFQKKGLGNASLITHWPYLLLVVSSLLSFLNWESKGVTVLLIISIAIFMHRYNVIKL